MYETSKGWSMVRKSDWEITNHGRWKRVKTSLLWSIANPQMTTVTYSRCSTTIHGYITINRAHHSLTFSLIHEATILCLNLRTHRLCQSAMLIRRTDCFLHACRGNLAFMLSFLLNLNEKAASSSPFFRVQGMTLCWLLFMTSLLHAVNNLEGRLWKLHSEFHITT